MLYISIGTGAVGYLHSNGVFLKPTLNCCPHIPCLKKYAHSLENCRYLKGTL
jgi:hypothetical protein